MMTWQRLPKLKCLWQRSLIHPIPRKPHPSRRCGSAVFTGPSHSPPLAWSSRLSQPRTRYLHPSGPTAFPFQQLSLARSSRHRPFVPSVRPTSRPSHYRWPWSSRHHPSLTGVQPLQSSHLHLSMFRRLCQSDAAAPFLCWRQLVMDSSGYDSLHRLTQNGYWTNT